MATFTVTTAADGGSGSLRDAIAQAAANPGADTIGFDPSLAGLIQLVSGPLVIAAGNDLTIDGDLGEGAPPYFMISGLRQSGSLLTIAAGASVTVAHINFADGHTVVAASTGYGQAGGTAIGAVANYGTLTVIDSVFQDNYARGGAGGPGNGYTTDLGGDGGAAAGGILNAGMLSVIGSFFIGNRAFGGDGGMGAGGPSEAFATDSGDGADAAAGILNLAGGVVTLTDVRFDSGTARGGDGADGAYGQSEGGEGGEGGYASAGVVSYGTLTGSASAGGGEGSGGTAGLGGPSPGTPAVPPGTPAMPGVPGQPGNAGAFDPLAIGLGSESADTLTGIPGPETLIGRGGNDSLDGAAGNDTLVGGSGTDTLTGGAGDDTYVDPAGDTIREFANGGLRDRVLSAAGYSIAGQDYVEDITLTGTARANAIGNERDNRLTGNAGDNILNGGAGNDRLAGLGGADKLNGGLGDDTYVDPDARDTIGEAAGAANGLHDRIVSAGGFSLRALPNVEDIALTGARNVNANGNSTANILTGNAGDNILNGGGGNDTLVGGAGDDTMNGGAGADLFKFATANAGADTIGGFETALDRFDLAGGAFLGRVESAGATTLTHTGGTILVYGVTGLSLAQWNALVVGGARGTPLDARLAAFHDDSIHIPVPLVHFAGADFLYA